MRVLNAAMDTKPISLDRFSVCDYSGLQLNSLTEVSLDSLLKLNLIKIASDGKVFELTLPDNLLWQGGEMIKSADFILGFKYFFKYQSNFANTFLRDIKKFYLNSRNTFSIILKEKNYKFIELLVNCRIIPVNKNQPLLSSGDYKISNKEKENIILKKINPIATQKPETINIHFIKDPYKNLSGFKNGLIDISSDTSFPYKEKNQESIKDFIRTKDTGLIACILFGNNLEKPENIAIRKIISNIINEIDFTDITYGQCKKLSIPEKNEIPHKIISKKKIDLEFDDYYPNYSICQKIKDDLEKFNFEINLRKSDFYNPEKNFDMKFHIFRCDQIYHFSYYLAISHLKPLTFSPQHLNYLKYLETWKSQIEDACVLKNNLEEIISSLTPLIPLFKIPSLYLSRVSYINPLIQSLCVNANQEGVLYA